VTASRLDLSPDPSVDYVVPKLQIVYEYLGHDVPGNEIMQAEGLQDLKDIRCVFEVQLLGQFHHLAGVLPTPRL